LSTRYNNRKIILSEQTLPPGKLLPGMILTFNYAEEGVTDPRPILLFLHQDKKTKLLEGLNLNYINPTKIEKLFNVVDFKKASTGMENLIALKNDYFRIRITTAKDPSPMTTKRFYSDVVSADNVFKQAYRSYKSSKVTSLKVTSIIEKLIHEPGGSPFD